MGIYGSIDLLLGLLRELLQKPAALPAAQQEHGLLREVVGVRRQGRRGRPAPDGGRAGGRAVDAEAGAAGAAPGGGQRGGAGGGGA